MDINGNSSAATEGGGGGGVSSYFNCKFPNHAKMISCPSRLIEMDTTESFKPTTNIMLTKRRPIILKRGRSSWPVTSTRTNHQKNLRDTCRGSAGAAESLEDRKFNVDVEIYSRRNSFLYRTDSIHSKYHNRPTSTKSSFSYTGDSAINETDEVVVTPYAQILLTLKFVQERLVQLFKEKNNTKEKKKSEEMIDTKPPISTIETLNNLEWCLYQLENIQTHRSVSDLASSKFKRLLNRELTSNNIHKSSSNVSQYICQTFTDGACLEMCLETKDQFDEDEDNAGDVDVDPNPEADPEVEADDEVDSDINYSGSRDQHQEHCNKLQTHWTSKQELLSPDDFCESDYKQIQSSHSVWMYRWDTDIFEMENLYKGNILYHVTMEIINERKLISTLKIDGELLSNYMHLIESQYNPGNRYHNSLHATDVLLSVNVMLSGSKLKSVFSDLEIFAALFAAAIHDVDHPGVTNQFLINTNNPLAILYNDNSVLENHHLATAFSLIHKPQYFFLSSLSQHQMQSFRRLVIDMVLATDMSKHMTMLADLKTTVETKKVSGSGILSLDNYNDRIQILQNLLHCADLSNPTKPLSLYLQWTNRVMEEFYHQGDQERELQIDISPMCDRDSASVPRSQVSFIDFVVYPLWESWADLIQPCANEMLDNLCENRAHYNRLINLTDQ